MRKVLFVLALVAVYGVSLAMQAPVVSYDDNETAVVSVMDNFDNDNDKEKKETKAKKDGCCASKAKAEGAEKKGECADKKSAECSKKSCEKKSEKK